MLDLQHALTTIRQGQYERGIAILTELVERETSRIEALGHRAWLYRSLGRLGKALEDYDRLIAENPNDLDGAAIRAETLLLLERPQEAMECVVGILQKKPSHDLAFQVLIRCRRTLGLPTYANTPIPLIAGMKVAGTHLHVPRGSFTRIIRDRLRFPSRYDYYEEYLRSHVGGKRVIDIGAMWLVDGRFSFFAEDCGAKEVVAFDIIEPSLTFREEMERKKSQVQFVQGDLMEDDSLCRLGKFDVVFCSGVIYHLPDPIIGLQRIRSICTGCALIGTAVIGEGFLRNRAVYYPCMDSLTRKWWNYGSKEKKIALDSPYDPSLGYANWFWGMSPSCVASMLYSVGFSILDVHYRRHFAFFECSV